MNYTQQQNNVPWQQKSTASSFLQVVEIRLILTKLNLSMFLRLTLLEPDKNRLAQPIVWFVSMTFKCHRTYLGNTHLLCQREYHCTADLLFGLDLTKQVNLLLIQH